MCSIEALLSNAIKQVYRSQLPTFFSSTLHLYDKMPSPFPENNSQLTDSSGIMTVGKRVRCAEMGGDNWAPQSHCDGRRLQSILFLTAPWQVHRVNWHACWSVEGKIGKEGQGNRIALLGSKEEKLPDHAAQAPLSCPFNRCRQKGLSLGFAVFGSSH